MTRSHLVSRAAAAPIVIAAAGLFGAATAHAQTEAALNQKFWVQLGAFRPSIDSTMQLTSSGTGLAGTTLSLEDDLGLPQRKSLGSLLLGARLADRWRLEFEHFSLKRTASAFPLETTVIVDDTTYPVSTQIDTEFDSRVYRLAVGYSFHKAPASEAGVTFGLHTTKFDASVSGVISLGGGAVVQREGDDATVPLPTIGLYGTYAFAPNWMVAGRVDYFSLKRGVYDGRLANLQANLIYRFTPQVGLGVGYRMDDYRLKETRDGAVTSIDYRFRGPQVFIEAGF
jgi:hypothetical protein